MITIGAQLFTLRTFMQNECDIRRSLKKVAEIGYKTVQISAIGPIDPHVLRDICDENGLKIVLTHNPEARILGDTDALIKEHDILGCDYIGIGSMPERYRSNAPEWVDYFAKDFETAAKKIRDAGKLLMYHNHDFEFETMPDGRMFIDVLMDGLSSDLMGFTLDTFWLQAAGCDVIDWLDRLKDRIPCVHLKDMTVAGRERRMAPVGEGNMNFKGIMKKLDEIGTTKYALVEQDTCYESPFVCMKKSYDNLVKLGYK